MRAAYNNSSLLNVSYPRSYAEQHGEMSRFIGFYLLPPVCLLGFVLNLVNVAVLTRKSFVGVPYSFMVAIAIADAITLLSTSVIAYARCHHDDCPIKSVLRLYYDVFIYLPVSNIVEGFSSLITVSLAIERYLSMVKYFWVRQHSSRWKLYGYIASITLISVLMGLPFAFIMWVDGKNAKKKQTAFFESRVYVWFSFVRPVLMVVAPLVLLVIFNGLLIRVTFIQRSRRNVRLKVSASANVRRQVCADEPSMIEPNEKGAGLQAGLKAEKRSARDKAEHKLTVMSICIILLFVIGHTPVMFAYAIIWSTFGGVVASPAHIAYTRFAQLLLMISISCNFFMYLHFNKHFKASLACRLSPKHSARSEQFTRHTHV